MADYLVEQGSGGFGWLLYEEGMERSYLASHCVPGQHFVKVSDVGTPEEAIQRAKAYFEGTHQGPETIDRWVDKWARKSGK